LECGGDHAQDGLCDHRARWNRLPDDTREYLEGKIRTGEAQHCPKCYLVQEKADGCDKLICPECSEHFCLKCGDTLGDDYVTDHLFQVRVGNTFLCRRTVIQKAFEGDDEYVDEVVAAYTNMSRRVIADVNEMFQNATDPETVPDKLRALFQEVVSDDPTDPETVPAKLRALFEADMPNNYQINDEGLLAAQMMGEDFEEMERRRRRRIERRHAEDLLAAQMMQEAFEEMERWRMRDDG
jgi:hypothetical protein